MTDTVHEFACPACGLQCRLSVKQRAVQHQQPDCTTFTAHRQRGEMQEFLRLALMAAGGGATNLGDVTIDIAPDTRLFR